jgi:predicted nucleic acid-binding protein
VPAIIYYELRRELLRARKASGLARLDAFAQSDPNGYLALTDEARSRALGKSLPAGTPYGPALDLDIDVILAAQALVLGLTAIVVTTNPRHLRQFVDARLWNDVNA